MAAVGLVADVEGRGQVVHDISGNGNHGRLGSSVRSTISRTLHVEPAARLPEDASEWYEGTPPG